MPPIDQPIRHVQALTIIASILYISIESSTQSDGLTTPYHTIPVKVRPPPPLLSHFQSPLRPIIPSYHFTCAVSLTNNPTVFDTCAADPRVDLLYATLTSHGVRSSHHGTHVSHNTIRRNIGRYLPYNPARSNPVPTRFGYDKSPFEALALIDSPSTSTLRT